MPLVLDSEVPLDLGTLFRALMAGEIDGVARYTAPESWHWPKVITKTEYKQYSDWHIPRMLNFESTISSWRGGHAAGLREGASGRLGAREVGHPDERPIAFSADQWINPADFPLLADYFRGINDNNLSRPQNFYGEGAAFEYLFAQRLIRSAWESESSSFLGNSVKGNPMAALVQMTTKSLHQFPSNLYDESVVKMPDWGQAPAPAVPQPTPTPKPTQPVVRGAHMKFDPPMQTKPFVATLDCPTGGTWAFQVDGGVVTLGSAPFWGAPTGLLVPGDAWYDIRPPIGTDPKPQKGGVGHYTCVSKQNRLYAY